MDFGLRFGGILHAATLGEAELEDLHQFREGFVIASAPPLRFAAEAGHPLRNIGLKTDALLFAIVADIDARLRLLIDNVANGAVHFRGQHFRVDRHALFALDQQFGESLAPRQAAYVRGKNAVLADEHWILV